MSENINRLLEQLSMASLSCPTVFLQCYSMLGLYCYTLDKDDDDDDDKLTCAE